MIHRRVVLAAMPACVGALAAGAVRAQDANAAMSPVIALDQGLEAVSKAGRATPFAQRVTMLTPVVTAAFSLEDVLRASVGTRYASLPEDQKATLLQVFTEYTVASYVANFDGSTGERFTVSPQTRMVGADQVVTTQFSPDAGVPTRLDYVVRQSAVGFRIIDVLIDGSISQVAVQRSDFRSLLSAGSAEKLISSLRKKTATLAAGGKS